MGIFILTSFRNREIIGCGISGKEKITAWNEQSFALPGDELQVRDMAQCTTRENGIELPRLLLQAFL